MLFEVAEALPDTCDQYLVITVGGTLLAMLGYREATRDVDSVERLDDTLRSAVELVASHHGLSPRWLNDAAAGFLPQTFDADRCHVLIEHPRLRVLGAPLDQIFVMKLYAYRVVDIEDLTSIWADCEFESPEAAADLYHRAYPHVAFDEYLADEIRRLVEGRGNSGGASS